jgi:hypothetical protein
MNLQVFEELLNEDEGTSLDFKREQYRFAGADNATKSELLKDILSFANAWRRTEAFILIGLEEVKGGKSKVLGITHHLNDNDLQQFVNEKTQRPVNFAYETVAHPDGQVGVIRIPVQQRPFYIKNDFGKLKKDKVYVRRGSSTAIATLDEIADMGKTNLPSEEQPAVDVEFFDPVYGEGLGKEIALCSTEVSVKPELLNERIYEFQVGRTPDFRRKMASYIIRRDFLQRVQLKVVNASTLAEDVLLVVEIPKRPHMMILESIEYPKKPGKTIFESVVPASLITYRTRAYQIDEKPSYWKLTVNFGTLRPRVSFVPDDCFYIGSHFERPLELPGMLFGNNITNPIPVELKIKLTVERRELESSELD